MATLIPKSYGIPQINVVFREGEGALYDKVLAFAQDNKRSKSMAAKILIEKGLNVIEKGTKNGK